MPVTNNLCITRKEQTSNGHDALLSFTRQRNLSSTGRVEAAGQLCGGGREPTGAAEVPVGVGALSERLRQPLDAVRGADGAGHRAVALEPADAGGAHGDP